MARSASSGDAIDVAVEKPVSIKQIAIFVTVSLGLLMSSIDSTIVAVGLPDMMRGLHTNLVWIGWVLTGYSLTQTMVLPMAGKLSDDLGRKRLFLGCVVLFTTSSLLCSIAPNVYILILCRIMQALGGGAFMPSAAGIVSDVFGAKRRGTAIGLFTSVFPIGGIVGPNIGGWVIDNFGWRAIFSVNVPIGIVLFISGVLLIPTGGRTGTRRSIDLLGAISFGFGIAAVLYGMTVWGNNISFDPQVAVWIVIGLASLVFFLRHESRYDNPMIEIRLLKERAFFAANLYNFLYGSMVFGFFSFMPLFATVAYGFSATEAGFILTPRAIAMIGMSAISSFALIRFGYRLPMIVGVLFVSVCLFLISRGWHDPLIFGHHMSNLILLSILMAIGGLGVGIGGPAANNAAIELMPEAVARITGLRGMFRNTGGVLGTAAIVLYMAHQQNQAIGMEHMFLVLSFMVLLVIPPVFLIPDGARSRRKAAHAPAVRAAISGE